MKLRELIERLEEIEADLQAGLGDDVEAEVVGAYQRNYPLAGVIDGACVLHDEDEDGPVLVQGKPVVWIAVGSHPHDMNPYAPRAVWAQLDS